MKGKFIVIEGLDGSGKSVQTQLLAKRLREEGCAVETIDFPQYGSWSGAFVERYLRGEFGSLHDVSARQASLFYALDRYAASFQIQQWLGAGSLVIANRYVSANKGHQLGKIEADERAEYLTWINTLEYDHLKNPLPDLTLFLHMAPAIGQQLVDRKGERPYLQGKRRDIHEDDISHLLRAEEAYLYCLKHDDRERWQKVTCFANDQPRKVEEIHEEIYALVTKLLL